MTRTRWWLLGSAAAIAIGLAVVAAMMAWSYRPAVLRAKAVASLSEHLGLDVTLEGLSVSFFPAFGLTGRGLVARIPERPDLPPFIVIETFRVDGGVQSVVRGHFSAAHLEGLKITIPPGEARKDIGPDNAPDANDGDSSWSKQVVIDRIDTPNAELTILRRKAGAEPLVFQVHQLELSDVGFDRRIPFRTKLTNPIPRGLVDSTGHLGPFPPGQPSELPVDGDYTFTGADLDTIKGIAGTLTSNGHYDGVISRLTVIGESETPDFSLDLGGRPLPLRAKFEVVVDGTNGATELKKVDATLLNTDIAVTGMIDNLPGPGNRSITLNANITRGRIEDLWQLVVPSDKPSFSGDVALQAAMTLPPGPGRKRDRWRIAGRFALAAAHFEQPQIQAKLAELSRRSQGKDADQAPADVFSNVRSQFSLDKGVLSLSALQFEVPGAAVRLAGQFETNSGALDLEGELRMQAAMSRVVGGWKGMLVKPFDFVFKRDGAGAVVPISVQGTRQSPDLNIQFGKLLKRGFGGK